MVTEPSSSQEPLLRVTPGVTCLVSLSGSHPSHTLSPSELPLLFSSRSGVPATELIRERVVDQRSSCCLLSCCDLGPPLSPHSKKMAVSQ